MKKFKKLSALFLSVLLLLSCMTITAYAAQSAAQDGLSAAIETDKESHEANEPILVTVTVTNNNSFAMKNVSIESILPASLTVQDGTLKSDTVDLEAGQELTLTFTAVLEKEVPPVTEPGTSEPDTSEPDTSEPDTTEPTVTDPSQTEPSETEPTVTEPTVTNPSTQPTTENPTAAGEVTTTEEQTTLTPETTTAVNAADHANGTSPITGAPAVALKVLLVVVMVAAVAFAVVMLTRKNGKKATKILSVVLSVVICGSSLVTTGMIAKAEENTRSFSVDKMITVDGENYTVSASVKYTVSEDMTLTIDQQDFETQTSSVSLSGTVKSELPIKSVQYEVCAEIDNDEASHMGSAEVNGDKWSIDDLKVKPGNNKIVITALTDETTVNKAIYIKYDIGQSYEVNDNNVKYDENSKVNYVNNIVLIFFADGVTSERVEQIVQENNGTIAGRVDFFYQMQIKESTYDEIEKICDELMKYDEVVFASPDLAKQYTESAIPNDPWQRGNDWNESNPSGVNWGVEAIEAVSAWDYDYRFSHMNIGVVDSGFDLNHEDLGQNLRPSTDWMESVNDYRQINENGITENDSHGTFVAGIIGAVDNNEKGTTGVLWDTNIYYTDWKPYAKEQSWDSVARIVSSLLYSVEAGAKVVNYSIGDKAEISYERFVNEFKGSLDLAQHYYSEEVINCEAGIFSLLMESLLERDFDFLVVQAAGNGRTIETEPNKKTVVAVDTGLNNGMFSFINESNVLASTNEMKKEILDRIIVVGAAKRNADGSYQQCEFSNGGNRVDLCAPGENIYGLAVNDKYVDGWNGTSLAAPYVTGVCGLVWSVNPNFTGAEVKDIVCNNTSITVSDNPSENHPLVDSYPMVNAKLSVKEAIRRSDAIFYGVTGTIMAEDTKEPIANATVSVYDGNTLLGQTQTDENGTYKLSFYSDTTSTHFTLEVYKSDRWPYINNQLELTSGMTTVVENIYMKPWDSGLDPGENPTPDDNFAGGDGSVENPYQIATARQLDAVRNHLDSNFVLINDIDLSEYSNWVPIGGYKNVEEGDGLRGSFDGQGHTISNLKMDYTITPSTDTQCNYHFGLFSDTSLSPEIRNINLKNINIKVSGKPVLDDYKDNAQIYISGLTTFGPSVLSDITASGRIVSLIERRNGIQMIGGITCRVDGANQLFDLITSLDIYVEIDTSSNFSHSGTVWLGGIIAEGGDITGNSGVLSINNCINYGNIEGKVITNFDSLYQSARIFCGGIVGDVTNAQLNNCHNFGKIQANSSDDTITGGIAGDSWQSSIIKCSNYGNVSADSYRIGDSVAGGIVGHVDNDSKIKCCVNFGNLSSICTTTQDVSTKAFVGGIAGKSAWSDIVIFEDSYNLASKIDAVSQTSSESCKAEVYIGRIIGSLDDSESFYLSNCYSIDSTLMNGLPATEDIGPDQKNGGSMSRAEIEKAVTDLGFELPA